MMLAYRFRPNPLVRLIYLGNMKMIDKCVLLHIVYFSVEEYSFVYYINYIYYLFISVRDCITYN